MSQASEASRGNPHSFSLCEFKMAGVKRRFCNDSDSHALHKELDEVLCPICMDHPHNAVLILCSSHEKGCRSYICDTSYRHSNCLDRYKKLGDDTTSPSSLPTSIASLTLRTHLIDTDENHNLDEDNNVISVQPGRSVEDIVQDPSRQLEIQGEGSLETVNFESLRERIEREETDVEKSLNSGFSLKCPLCRGAVFGWMVVEEARSYLNLKKRSCSRESCSFSGNYRELRRHARRVHPTTRPSAIDPSREQAWRCLERQREYGDIVSAVRSAMPGAVVVGDYVIENGDRLPVERESGTGEGSTPWLTTLLLFQMIGSIDGVPEPRSRSRAWTRQRRPGGILPERRFLWGENLLGLQDDNDSSGSDLHILSDAGEDASPVPRRRRRLTRSRSDDRS